MVQTATYIRNKLEKENLLGQAFSFNPERGTPDFRLVLVGHSLGAGTAAILALLLRHEYPHVHCYAYSPPGGLLRYYSDHEGLQNIRNAKLEPYNSVSLINMKKSVQTFAFKSLPAAEFTKGFVTSVVVGKDVVPRLGLHQLETLRTSLMTAIKKSTEPKVTRLIINLEFVIRFLFIRHRLRLIIIFLELSKSTNLFVMNSGRFSVQV